MASWIMLQFRISLWLRSEHCGQTNVGLSCPFQKFGKMAKLVIHKW